MDSLRKCLKLDRLRKALNTLPKTLNDTYERILSNLDEEYEADAVKILQWLCFSARTMRLDEMVEVLAIDSRFRPEQRLPDPEDVLTICSSLVSITAAATNDTSKQSVGAQQLKLAHFSVKEYLISDRLKKASIQCYYISSLSANASIGKTCLTYLLHFEDPIISTAEICDKFPLIRYAAEYWPLHYRAITNDADKKAVNFLGWNLVKVKTSFFANWLRMCISTDRIIDVLNVKTNGDPPPLYYMSYLGVTGVVQALLNDEADVNAQGGLYGNALSAASYNGHEEVVQLLLEKGANVNAEGGQYGNALSAA